MDGFLDRVLATLAARPTLILPEPLASSYLRRRSMFQEVSPEAAQEFVRRWSRKLAKGWVDKFFPDLSEKMKEELAAKIQEKLLEGI